MDQSAERSYAEQKAFCVSLPWQIGVVEQANQPEVLSQAWVKFEPYWLMRRAHLGESPQENVLV